MQMLYRFFSERILFKQKLLVYISILSVLLALGLPAYMYFSIYPSFTELLMETTEDDSIRVASHLASMQFLGTTEFNKDTLPTDLVHNVNILKRDMGLQKIRVWSRVGEIIHSSNSAEIGRLNAKKFFQDLIDKKKPICYITDKGEKTLEDQIAPVDLVETYIPILNGDRVLGVFEIHYDISLRKNQLDDLLSNSLMLLITLSGGLLAVVFIVLFKENKNIIERKQARAALRESHAELENRVKERTAEFIVVNRELKSEIGLRKLTEQQLEESKTNLQDLFDGISDPLVQVGADMQIQMMNKAAAEYFGSDTLETPAGRTCFQTFKNASEHCKGCDIPLAVSRRQKTTFERRGLRNPERLEQVAIYPLKSLDGKKGDAIIRISDVTEERLKERQLIQAEKMSSLGLLVSATAHELQNPNGVITLNLPILRDYLHELLPMLDKCFEDNRDYVAFRMPYQEIRREIYQLIDNMENSSNQITSFVAYLKEYSQLKEEKKFESVSLKSLVEQTLIICGNQISKTFKSFVMNIPKDLPPVCTDAQALKQVLINFLINAAQAADKKDSWLKLSAGSGNSWREHTKIEISDNGCGMDEITQQKIFDPFFTTKSEESGTGLGLYICYDLVNALGGRIEVESEPAKGTLFRVILPDKERRRFKRI